MVTSVAFFDMCIGSPSSQLNLHLQPQHCFTLDQHVTLPTSFQTKSTWLTSTPCNHLKLTLLPIDLMLLNYLKSDITENYVQLAENWQQEVDVVFQKTKWHFLDSWSAISLPFGFSAIVAKPLAKL